MSGVCIDCPLPTLCKAKGCFGPEPIHIGVSGSRHPDQITKDQRRTLSRTLESFTSEHSGPLAVLHHGCATGWDSMAHFRALEVGLEIHCHPPIAETFMAALPTSDDVTWHAPKVYRNRDQDVVDAVSLLIAAPAHPEQDARSARSGTWMTIRMARRAGVPILFIHHNGVRMLEVNGSYVRVPEG